MVRTAWVLIGGLAGAACSKGSERPPELMSTEHGEPSPRNADREQQLLRQCDAGTNAACEELEGLYLQAHRRADTAALVERLCEGGRRFFCPTFAFVLDTGDGIARDRARARQLFADSCKDDPKACSEYGSLYLSGTGVVKDLELGCFLAGQACGYGDQDACRDAKSCGPR